eukprot:1191443-Prorocentrum_minimum.AAC.3
MAAHMATSTGLTCTAAISPASQKATRLTARSAYGPQNNKLVCGKASASQTACKEVCSCFARKSSVWMHRATRSQGKDIVRWVGSARSTRPATARAAAADLEETPENPDIQAHRDEVLPSSKHPRCFAVGCIGHLAARFSRNWVSHLSNILTQGQFVCT